MQKNNYKTDYLKLKERLVELAYVRSALAVLGWDQEVHMPKKAAMARAKTIGELQGIIHEKFININHDRILSKLNEQLKDTKDRKTEINKKKKTEKISEDEAIIIAETWRGYERARKLPAAFVKEMAEVTSRAQSIWAEARKTSNFSLFEPYLKQIFDLKRKEAHYIGFKNSPYDALIDDFEPGMTAEKASEVLENLKAFLIPCIKEIQARQKKQKNISIKKVLGNFPIEKQYEFNKFISQKIGFDLEAGKIDISTHPFTTNLHPTDVRFTTRYNTKNVLYALGSTIHEAGHALYEQGLPEEHFGTALGDAISLGIHESQSRMWENTIGKSYEFWKFFYPTLKKQFPNPFSKVLLEDFYALLNRVEPSYIRTESDEVTYNLHIIIRFEIERALIEKKLQVKDAPRVWREKMKEYLGIDVKEDRFGILQDVHWSAGLIGYFPTYSFGNLYAAQFYHTMEQQIPNLKKKIAKGEFAVIVDWLRKNIHIHGKKFTADALVEQVTGEKLTSRYFEEYILKKYLSQ